MRIPSRMEFSERTSKSSARSAAERAKLINRD
jgi:hypothetical protein